MRGPIAWPPLPLMLTRAARFDELVLDAATMVEQRLGRRLDLELAVEEVPPSDPAPWEYHVPLARLFPAEGGVPARLVLYRRPIEQRCHDDVERAALVHEVVVEQVAQALGQDPEDLF